MVRLAKNPPRHDKLMVRLARKPILNCHTKPHVRGDLTSRYTKLSLRLAKFQPGDSSTSSRARLHHGGIGRVRPDRGVIGQAGQTTVLLVELGQTTVLVVELGQTTVLLVELG
ncbi:unnamed protein product [Prunus armeniaca]|nr:hypothetical protein GBA52_014960 [Prunus armeniaca]